MKLGPICAWLLSLACLLSGAATANEFLEPAQAFRLQGELRDAHTLVVSWAIAPGYHLYRERLAFKADTADAGLGPPLLPAGVRKFDENFNKEVETYQRKLVVTLPLAPASAVHEFTLMVGYQGCADAGLCYPPTEQAYIVDPARPGPLTLVPAAATPAGTAGAAATTAPLAAPDDSTLAQRTLQSGSLWRIGSAFLVFGLLLSFTPCVLPMVPILSSIIVGEGKITRSRGLILALAYSAGMALVYTALGVAAGLAGEGLAGALQKPWVLLTFGALLVGLALSMFDVYQLQLPGTLQTRLSATSGRLRGGRFIGVFVMGALSALIVGPCVAGPLAGALLYISQTGNASIGAWALFSMAVGMSVPLLLTGLSAGTLLPRAGAWMNVVKRVFGLLLIGVAIWMVSPIFPVAVLMALWGCLALLCAVFLGVGVPLPAGSKLGAYAGKTLGLALLLYGLFELIGAASSGQDVLQPLAHLRRTGAAPAGDHAVPRFTRIRNVADLDQALAAAGTPVLLDFYADWCVACKEMERMTFSEAKVSAAMDKMRLIQVDVTANNDDDRALMRRFKLFGPPGIILFDGAGKEITDGRIIGFTPAVSFLPLLLRAQAPADFGTPTLHSGAPRGERAGDA
jgi:thiol:disulfide interchange protein DsbD